MKIFSAYGLEHKELSLIEFASELEALPLINELPNHVKLIDMFSLLNNHFVALISCKDLKKVHQELMNHPSVVDGYFTNDTNMESLHAFYYLNKPQLSEALIVITTSKICKAFEIIDQAHHAGIHILDIKNQRSHNQNTLYLSSTVQNLMEFKNTLGQHSDIKYQMLDKLSDSLVNFLG